MTCLGHIHTHTHTHTPERDGSPHTHTHKDSVFPVEGCCPSTSLLFHMVSWICCCFALFRASLMSHPSRMIFNVAMAATICFLFRRSSLCCFLMSLSNVTYTHTHTHSLSLSLSLKRKGAARADWRERRCSLGGSQTEDHHTHWRRKNGEEGTEKSKAGQQNHPSAWWRRSHKAQTGPPLKHTHQGVGG